MHALDAALLIAFSTLAITEVTSLAVVALIPLAAFLLYISHRFGWQRFAYLGLIATYAACILRGDHRAFALSLATALAAGAMFLHLAWPRRSRSSRSPSARPSSIRDTVPVAAPPSPIGMMAVARTGAAVHSPRARTANTRS
jgi:hypothetical protein